MAAYLPLPLTLTPRGTSLPPRAGAGFPERGEQPNPDEEGAGEHGGPGVHPRRAAGALHETRPCERMDRRRQAHESGPVRGKNLRHPAVVRTLLRRGPWRGFGNLSFFLLPSQPERDSYPSLAA